MPTIDRNFDGGQVRIDGTQSSTDTYIAANGNVHVRPTLIFGGGWRYWAVRVLDAGGPAPTVVLNANNRYVRAANSNMMLCVASTDPDGADWQPYTVQSVASGIYTLAPPAGLTVAAGGTLYLASHPLVPTTRWAARFAEWITHPHVTDPTASGTAWTVMTTTPRLDNLGRTAPALPVRALRITDPGYTGDKVHVTVQAGNHCDEHVAHHAADGAITFLLSDDPVAVWLRQRCVFTVVWGANPQGIWSGYVRSAPQDIDQDHNRDWAAPHTFETTAALAAFWQSQPNDVRVVIDFHCVPWEGNSELWWHSSTFAAHPEFLAALEARHGAIHTEISENAGTYRNLWLDDASRSPLLQLVITPEETIAKTKTVASNIAYGEAVVGALYDVILAGHVTAATPGESPPDPIYVLDRRDRALPAGSWTTLSAVVLGTAAALPQAVQFARSLDGLPAGSRELQVGVRLDTEAAPETWVGQTYEVALEVEPPPVGSWFAVNGVVYLVLGEGAELLDIEPASGAAVRTVTGDLVSTADGARLSWRIPLYDLSQAEHATLRAAIRRQRRATVGGRLFGAARETGFLATVELVDSRYVWDGAGFRRAPTLLVRTVEPVAV